MFSSVSSQEKQTFSKYLLLYLSDESSGFASFSHKSLITSFSANLFRASAGFLFLYVLNINHLADWDLLPLCNPSQWTSSVQYIFGDEALQDLRRERCVPSYPPASITANLSYPGITSYLLHPVSYCTFQSSGPWNQTVGDLRPSDHRLPSNATSRKNYGFPIFLPHFLPFGWWFQQWNCSTLWLTLNLTHSCISAEVAAGFLFVSLSFLHNTALDCSSIVWMRCELYSYWCWGADMGDKNKTTGNEGAAVGCFRGNHFHQHWIRCWETELNLGKDDVSDTSLCSLDGCCTWSTVNIKALRFKLPQ